MKRTVLMLMVGLIAAGSLAQETFYSIFSYTHFIPSVMINDRSVSLQNDLYPDWYREHSAARDMRWLRENDSAVTEFWQTQGDTILHILCELSGIEWQESDIDIHLVRYFPSLGSSEPLIVPLGGIKTGALIEAVPTDHRLKLNLVFQLAKRMLAQTVQPRYNVVLGIAGHPLMRPGPFRRDNLAMLLALATCDNVLGMDSTYDAFKSEWWQRQAPGREILRRHFLPQWILTPDQTLADWITQESFGSHLVALTRQPRPSQAKASIPPKHFVEDLPLKGLFGFSVSIDDQGFLVVDSMDIYRLGFACGLRSGDRIRTVDGVRVRSHKTLVEQIFETFRKGGATLAVERNGQNTSLIIQPMLLPWIEDEEEYYDDEYFTNDYPFDPDSLPPDTDSVSLDHQEN